MTDNEIIKFMQCVMGNDANCSECRYQKVLPFPSCRMMCAKNALDLINRQKAEIKKLNMDNKEINILINMQEKNIREQQVIIDTLRILNKSVASEAIKEFAEKIDKFLERYSHIHEDAERAMSDVIECDNETIEMQSVWDVHTLIANEMGSEPEEMNRLQDNIETIAKERLLKEIEKDLRLLVKEMAEVEK